MIVFENKRKIIIILFLVALLAAFVIFFANYFVYVKYVKEKPSQEGISSEQGEEEVDYKEVEKTLTAPSNDFPIISDKSLKDISASKETEVSDKVLDSLTAPK